MPYQGRIMAIKENYPQRSLAFISLALGFLVIWTVVLAGILVSRTLKEEGTAKQTTRVFSIHEDVGKISFALGHELVSTVDWLLSQGSKEGQSKTDLYVVTWKTTDSVLRSVQETSTDRWVTSVLQVLDQVQVKLKKFRGTLTEESSPYNVVEFYLGLSNMILNKCFILDYGQQLPVPSLSYTLFIQGMSQRFGELALGTIYVKSDLPFNKTGYLSLREGSTQLMSTSFHFTPRARAKWAELQEQEPGVERVLEMVAEDILAGGQMRGGSELAKAYLGGVTEEVAMLLLTKDVLNATLSSSIQRLSQRTHNTLAFHMSVCVVAVVAVIVCLIITGCAFRHIGQNQGNFINFNNTSSADCPETHDKAQILSGSGYFKPQCHL
ncbi:uncharacterized protein LOC106459145 isoform X1 [Limulus polyphemus]|uniref:Uncharacterized protein LOC106459145 isoform X1 n=2 Tax=Limulus polyphemus TaxID=6850 RepID=A0ABM1B3Q3_LIMPO|nr:uncharacterized protein LOC106459145 isoform X1 [Limulus polyphemus]XP_013774190.1 uncharacterized protein LOC106459145 isoform X1 [Limulus polyphemus]XP_013774192.1 uncharacterized protein LOC106459145 isoform X1 [Limulus polyphemus]